METLIWASMAVLDVGCGNIVEDTKGTPQKSVKDFTFSKSIGKKMKTKARLKGGQRLQQINEGSLQKHQGTLLRY
ncbi:hypothetical protein BHE74_00021356 [Ensete ventricosum]|uniref:Uncharacterized protein n=1 Tax=Ensete ventricosum TaxID=4639 RepID=A0A445MLI8_ENSVE|nr:hypothetical protein BHE74_00021356 [Ensete ventricosum]RZR75083.1 hypothetical protein BHM03_00049073 [Ensete ventricosum]